MKTILIICGVTLNIAFSQEYDMMDQDHVIQGESGRRGRMESMMIWRLTEELELKPDQAEIFFPRFREHRNNLEKIREQEREIAKILRKKLKKGESVKKPEVVTAVKKVTNLRKKHADSEEKFILGMDDILDAVQMTKLGIFKQNMMKEISGEVKKRGNRRNKMKKMNRKHGKRRNRSFWN